MTSRTRNISIIAAMVLVLAGAGLIIATKETVLGLDLRGGVELVYEGRQATPQSPPVTPENIDDAIETIRKRTDALGVSEPEIQRSGANQISIGLPNVENTERAQEQVGTTAQLQFYDFEPNVLGDRGPDDPFRGSKALYDAVQAASKAKGKAEPTDLPPSGASAKVKERFGDDEKAIQEYYDRENDSGGDKYYLFGPDSQLIAGPDSSCEELLADFEGVEGPDRTDGAIPKGSECEAELKKIPEGEAKAESGQSSAQDTGPPVGSRVLKVPQGVVVVEAERAPNQPESINSYYIFEDDSELSGSDIENPEQNTDQQTQEPIVTMEFTKKGREAFATVTKRIAERSAETTALLPPGTSEQERQSQLQRFAITLDNEVVSIATIDNRENPEGIDGRTGAQINGIGDLKQTQELAEQLRIGSLPINLKLISQTSVSATLGQQALHQGLIAGGVGLLLTILFLLVFYRVLGAVAAAALVVYAVLLFALVKLIPITLTLPGIAGLILTLGIAADANIVIFERVKEEARSGKSVPAAIAGGYAKALRTIIDANVVTIGVAFILFTLATAGVRGFAFTLGLGTIISLFTAVLATSAILGAMSRTRVMKRGFAIGAKKSEGGGWKFDFIGKSKWFFSASGVILVIGSLAIAGLGINFGIDFESGTRIKTPVTQDASVDDVRDALDPLGYGDSKIQKVNEPELGDTVFQIATPSLAPDEVQEVQDTLNERFGVEQGDFSSSSIGPTFGEQIARTALIAIVASLLLISIYISLRFEAKFAVPVLIAVAHDILITTGVYAIFDREVTTSTVAALLTILGYSLYDTIIVFDRIRENVPRMPRATFSQIVNRSMSEVLTRSLATSLCTLFPVGALMLFGGETLRDFAFALLVGIASGAYSSIFIASPVLTLWKEREAVYVRRRRIVMADNDGRVPAFDTGVLGGRAQVATAGGPAASRQRRARPAAPPPAAGRGQVTPATATGPVAPTAPAAPAAEPPKPDGDGEAPPTSATGAGGSSSPGPANVKRVPKSKGRKKHGRRR